MAAECLGAPFSQYTFPDVVTIQPQNNHIVWVNRRYTPTDLRSTTPVQRCKFIGIESIKYRYESDVVCRCLVFVVTHYAGFHHLFLPPDTTSGTVIFIVIFLFKWRIYFIFVLQKRLLLLDHDMNLCSAHKHATLKIWCSQYARNRRILPAYHRQPTSIAQRNSIIYLIITSSVNCQVIVFDCLTTDYFYIVHPIPDNLNNIPKAWCYQVNAPSELYCRDKEELRLLPYSHATRCEEWSTLRQMLPSKGYINKYASPRWGTGPPHNVSYKQEAPSRFPHINSPMTRYSLICYINLIF